MMRAAYMVALLVCMGAGVALADGFAKQQQGKKLPAPPVAGSTPPKDTPAPLAWKVCRVCVGKGSCCGISGGSGWRRKSDKQCVGEDASLVHNECGAKRERCEWVGCLRRDGWRSLR